jgi:hypothetical protein
MAAKMKKTVFIALFIIATISFVHAQCAENWQCDDWSRCLNEMTERNCIDLNHCAEIEKPSETVSCKEAWPYCYDRITNQDESDTDCGGKVCAKCDNGRTCFSNDDCQTGICMDNTCYSEQEIPAPQISPSLMERALTIALAIIVIFAGILVMKRLKRQKILVIERRESKEEAKKEVKVISKMHIAKTAKKSKIDKFVENFKDYLSSIKPDKKQKIREEKDLLNKIPYKKQEHPAVKSWMLQNIKEAYNE